LPSRLELKSEAGSFKDAPLKKFSFTTDLYDSPVQMPPSISDAYFNLTYGILNLLRLETP
jgi:hypothetical protein